MLLPRLRLLTMMVLVAVAASTLGVGIMREGQARRARYHRIAVLHRAQEAKMARAVAIIEADLARQRSDLERMQERLADAESALHRHTSGSQAGGRTGDGAQGEPPRDSAEEIRRAEELVLMLGRSVAQSEQRASTQRGRVAGYREQQAFHARKKQEYPSRRW
jgi:hypothetical protein